MRRGGLDRGMQTGAQRPGVDVEEGAQGPQRPWGGVDLRASHAELAWNGGGMMKKEVMVLFGIIFENIFSPFLGSGAH